MEILHRVMFNKTSKEIFFHTVEDLGLITKTSQLPTNGGLLVFVDISESNPHWPIISELISTFGASDKYDSVFTEEEVRSAEWLRLISTFEQGYPYPKGPWPFKQPGRPLLCQRCATYVQTGPIQLAKEPHLGKKSFMSLIWQNDFFCSSEVFRGLAEINSRGYEPMEVLIHTTGLPSKEIKQLFVQNITSPGTIIDYEYEGIICPDCGVKKFPPHMRGVMKLKRDAIVPNVDFMLTNEWFGHGYLAWREILVSNRVAKLMLDKGWQGVRFKVLEVT
jgi:hypothetical protein